MSTTRTSVCTCIARPGLGSSKLVPAVSAVLSQDIMDDTQNLKDHEGAQGVDAWNVVALPPILSEDKALRIYQINGPRNET